MEIDEYGNVFGLDFDPYGDLLTALDNNGCTINNSIFC